MKIITLGCIVLLILSACNLFNGTGMIRPVTLTVTDNETGLPVSDITVYYRLVKAGPASLAEVDYKIIELEKLKTNDNGKITIPPRGYTLGPLELLHGQYFYINLDTKDGRMATEREIYHFARVFISSNNRIDDSIVLANSSYFATAVYLWNEPVKKESTDFSSNFFRYDFAAPFSGKEMNITVMLARNTN